MKLQLMSDLHLPTMGPGDREKFFQNLQPEQDATLVLVLAGDIFDLTHQHLPDTVAALAEFSARWPHVLYVPGNHEFWGTSIEDGYATLEKLLKPHPGFHLLRTGRALELHGKRFHGDTMWFPNDSDNVFYERFMPDFRFIGSEFGPTAYRTNSQFREHLTLKSQPGDVVITHHSCSPLSIPAEFIGSAINRFFVSDMTKVIEKTKPALWVHGHTHGQFDYTLHNTRVVCNPRGYPGEQSIKVWKPKLVVEV